MRILTKNIGSSQNTSKSDLKHLSDIKKVLVCRPNQRLGNQLLLTPLIQELINTFPNCKIDLFVKGGVAHPIFKNYEQVDTIIVLPRKPFSHLLDYGWRWFKIKNKHYDLVVNGDKNSSSGRLSTECAHATHKVFGDVIEEVRNTYSDHAHISKYPIYNLRYYLAQLGFPNPSREVPVLDIKLSVSEIAEGKKILERIVKTDKKIICIYTNATGNKCYSETWWHALYNRLKIEYPDCYIIEMLPIENISKINFKAPHFYSEDIRQMASVIRNTAVFISADNGVMHLASASLTPTVGFFSTTNPDIYKPYGNGSIAIHTAQTNMDEWIREIDSIIK
ncbi:glycosyltransferase family 9 protein [Mariniflexile ostreae]|uniref:Glycosyltransferase family 9 protein n=1 Tax=Mariniflexile ostreae TaxID=1520892 RepID=A0ABV5FDZ0_9FLAO